jgi:hypothetical protein
VVKLRNRTRSTLLTFNLEHPSLLVNGKPGVLTILAGQVVEAPVEVLECAEVKSALRWQGDRPPQLQAIVG